MFTDLTPISFITIHVHVYIPKRCMTILANDVDPDELARDCT